MFIIRNTRNSIGKFWRTLYCCIFQKISPHMAPLMLLHTTQESGRLYRSAAPLAQFEASTPASLHLRRKGGVEVRPGKVLWGCPANSRPCRTFSGGGACSLFRHSQKPYHRDRCIFHLSHMYMYIYICIYIYTHTYINIKICGKIYARVLRL